LPPAGVLAADSAQGGAPAVGASAWTTSLRDFFRLRLVAVALGCLGLGVVLYPNAALALALLGIVIALAAVAPRATACVLGLAGAGIALVAWPGLALPLAAIAAIAVLARRTPTVAFAVALSVFAAEGSIKALLTYWGRPSGISGVALGALLVDLALIIAVTGLLVSDRGAAVRALWSRLDALGRAAVVSLVGWLLVSGAQIMVSGRIAEGVLGFRVTQAYVVAVLAGVVLAARASSARVPLILGAISPIALYAAVRVALGPSLTERMFTLHRPGVTQYGAAVRAVGSFSGAVGLASFLVPSAAFALGLLVASRRHRAWAGGVLVCSTIGIVATYTRAALVALAVGAVAVLALRLLLPVPSAPRRAAAVGFVTLLIAGGTAATLVSAAASPQVRQRIDAVLHPGRDASLRIRLTTWRRMLSTAWRNPAGEGLGHVGRASATGGGSTVTADQSYLKILVEQGVIGAALFVFGVLAGCVAIVRRLRGAPPSAQPLAVAAFAGFVAFLVLGCFGEYIEQPGKVLAWTFLGIAAWQAHARAAVT
jgi:hypothetical protein